MSIIPDFNSRGLLPPGDCEVTFAELRNSILVDRPNLKNPGNWDGNWRSKLIDNCEILVNQLWQIGITEIFLNGSFVEEKDHPNDIDGYFECDFSEFVSGQIQRELNKIDSIKSGLGIQNLEERIEDMLRSNYQCGMFIEWNCIRIMEIHPD